MFSIEDEVASYIWQRGNAIVVSLKHEPAVGDIYCASKMLSGCLIPQIQINLEESELETFFQRTYSNGVIVYHHPDICTKKGYAEIRVILRRLWLWEWLELEGARILPIFIN
jgi:hypothetical protein